LRAGGVWHAVGKLSTKAMTLVQTPSLLEVYTRSYSPAKLRDSQPWRFRDSQPWWFWDSHLGVSGQKTIRMPLLWSGVEYTIWGKVLVPPSLSHGESCESEVVTLPSTKGVPTLC
jgi:hypothetical protein